MRRRTSGRKFTWFPTIGTEVGAGEPPDQLAGRQFTIPTIVDGSINTAVTPITVDTPVDESSLGAGGSGDLVRVIGNEYILERIVGKLFAALQPRRNAANDPSLPDSVLFAAGFFVARANDQDSGGGSSTPIGSASIAERTANYSPLVIDTIREPWIWRRTWALGNTAFTDIQHASQIVSFNTVNSGNPGANYPPTTAHYGSVMDGPHIDAKSNRKISNDDRLWFAISVCHWPRSVGTSVNNSLDVEGYLDYRLLGRLVKARGKSSF